MAKRFALVSFGVLCLGITALIFNNLMTPKADAEAGKTIVGYVTDGVGSHHFVITSNGDIYRNDGINVVRKPNGDVLVADFGSDPTYIGNFWKAK
jgi:hypothetical protein